MVVFGYYKSDIKKSGQKKSLPDRELNAGLPLNYAGARTD